MMLDQDKILAYIKVSLDEKRLVQLALPTAGI